MNKIILVIVAHSDDEVLGCGGTLIKHVQAGDSVHLIVLADGVSSRESTDGLNMRERALSRSCKFLGISLYKEFKYPDNKMDTVPLLDIVKGIEKSIIELKPDVIYTHSYNDLNIDHVITHKAVMTACRPQLPGVIVPEILSFYIPSSSEWLSYSMGEVFRPNKFVDIDPYFKQKIEALKCYMMEMREYPHPRSFKGVEIIANYYGNIVGLDKAECFCVERIIEREVL